MRRVHVTCITMVAIHVLASSCRTAGSGDRGASVVKADQPYDAMLDAASGEKLWPGEADEAARIRDTIVASVKSYGGPEVRPPLHPPGPMLRRDAHPKAHGCVEARFEVLPDLDPRFAKGIFAQPRVYDATIRYSNGNGDPTRHDIKGDGRGMAIKVHGVQGTRLVEGGDVDSQDFIMINFPVFFVAKPQSYLPIVRAVADGSISAAAGAAGTVLWEPLDAAIIAQMATLRILNPLQEQYWSEVPYRLGEEGQGMPVKFTAKPLACPGSEPAPSLLAKKARLAEIATQSLVTDRDHNYLRDAMVKSLAVGGTTPRQACFEFQMQPAVAGDSVEDPRREWRGAFTTVARVTIPAQTFNTPEQDLRCEKLSYSPWDGITAHRPLGGVNRIRRLVYEGVSQRRHSGVP